MTHKIYKNIKTARNIGKYIVHTPKKSHLPSGKKKTIRWHTPYLFQNLIETSGELLKSTRKFPIAQKDMADGQIERHRKYIFERIGKSIFVYVTRVDGFHR